MVRLTCCAPGGVASPLMVFASCEISFVSTRRKRPGLAATVLSRSRQTTSWFLGSKGLIVCERDLCEVSPRTRRNRLVVLDSTSIAPGRYSMLLSLSPPSDDVRVLWGWPSLSLSG